MDDRFRELLEHSLQDAMYVWMDNQEADDVEIGYQFIEDATIQLFQMRAQKYMVRWQMAKTQEMRSSGPDTDSGIGLQ